jgi:hypothetical protein
MTQRGKLARILEHSYSAAGEKSLTFLLLIFRKGNPSALKPQDGEKTYQWCHSERSEESTFYHFLKDEILRPYGLRMTRKGRSTKILEHPLRRIYKNSIISYF